MTGDLRDALIRTMDEFVIGYADGEHNITPDTGGCVDALLPVVEEYARQRAADELRKVANHAESRRIAGNLWVRALLRDRADDLAGYVRDETPVTLSPPDHTTPHPETAPPAAQGRETPTQPQPPGEERTRRDLT